ncbi:MAG: hypothetical protein ACYCXA_11615 [Actinomycetes bacterium]
MLRRVLELNVGLVAQELSIAPQNVYRTVEPLEETGMITSSRSQRDRVWHSAEVLAAVDAFAARAGRRARSS